MQALKHQIAGLTDTYDYASQQRNQAEAKLRETVGQMEALRSEFEIELKQLNAEKEHLKEQLEVAKQNETARATIEGKFESEVVLMQEQLKTEKVES